MLCVSSVVGFPFAESPKELYAQTSGPLAQCYATIDPGNPYALVNLGVAFEKEGEYEQTIQVCERILAQAADQIPGDGRSLAVVPSHLVKRAKENLNHAKNLWQK